jgi:radical SAM superfamily enzyme YgiQ (UPF0313 family)
MLFRDPLFGINRDFVLGLCELMLKHNLKLKWVCETRMDLLSKQMIDIMYRSGLRVINTGIESSNPDVLKKASRVPVKLQQQEEIIRYCDKLGIRVTAFYILGLPEDTYNGILDTINYAKHLNTHVAQFFIHTPFPGTEYFEQVKADITEKDWQRFDCYTPVLRHRNLTAGQILGLKEKAFINYYYRPKYLANFMARCFRDFLN